MASPLGLGGPPTCGPPPPPDPGVVTGIPPAVGPVLLAVPGTAPPPFPLLNLNWGLLTLITASTPLAIAVKSSCSLLNGILCASRFWLTANSSGLTPSTANSGNIPLNLLSPACASALCIYCTAGP